MSKQFAKLATKLDRDNWMWLEKDNEELARAVEAEVIAGGDPEAIGRFMTRHIGENRGALIARVVSAARHVQSLQVA